ncbi:MAG TPA: hypothetical protein VEC99_18765 [Clostridia bacterium]|nr:hypothetical protein [Clostridia bacterium]
MNNKVSLFNWFRIVVGVLLVHTSVLGGGSIGLHPENPHYLVFRDKPTVLITSAEHYGAVLNLDFNHTKYLDSLQKDGLNLTKIFTGTYVEYSGAFYIASNTLAPATGRFICPWSRSITPGCADGGTKFDLSQFDKNYFVRLKSFVSEASQRGIVVEVCLFCSFFSDREWALSPLNPANNINSLGRVWRDKVYTMDKHGGLLQFQEAMVRAIVTELKEFDNVFYEVCNEPYFGGATKEWQDHMTDVILKSEGDLPAKHLIAHNIANGTAAIKDPHPGVSIFNFHYAAPPDAVPLNYHLNKVIGDDETGFNGTQDWAYRNEGWNFIFAGGSLFNSLDFSFAVGFEDGTFVYRPGQPGGGSPTLRKQLGILKRFVDSLDFVHMKPDNSVIVGGVPAGFSARALVEDKKTYAVYIGRLPKTAIEGSCAANLQIMLPAGRYDVEWLNPTTGEITKGDQLQHEGGKATLSTPAFSDDTALRISRK